MSGDVTFIPVSTEQTPLPYGVIAVSNDNPSAKALAAMFRHEDDRERFVSGRSFTDTELQAYAERIIEATLDHIARPGKAEAWAVDPDAIIAAAEAER